MWLLDPLVVRDMPVCRNDNAPAFITLVKQAE